MIPNPLFPYDLPDDPQERLAFCWDLVLERVCDLEGLALDTEGRLEEVEGLIAKLGATADPKMVAQGMGEGGSDLDRRKIAVHHVLLTAIGDALGSDQGVRCLTLLLALSRGFQMSESSGRRRRRKAG